MSFDYSAAKAAIQEAGHTVSKGPQVLAADVKEIVKFGRRVFGLSEIAVRRGIANTALLPEGFPGVAAAPVIETAVEAPKAAPAPQEAPKEVTTAESAPKAKKAKKDAEESAPTETPAEVVAAPEAPAAEQAAQ